MLNATGLLENYTGHLQVSFMLAFHGPFSSEGVQSVSNQALNANVTLYLGQSKQFKAKISSEVYTIPKSHPKSLVLISLKFVS